MPSLLRNQHDWLRHRRLREAARLAESGDTGSALELLRTHLKQRPRDAHALHLLAGLVRSQGRSGQAFALWQRASEAAPNFAPARLSYADALLDSNRPDDALLQLEAVPEREPPDPDHLALKARTLEALDDVLGAADLWRRLLDDEPENTEYLTRYAWVLRALGRSDESVAVYRSVIALQPGFGGAWWNLADIKTFRFTETDIAVMEDLVEHAGNASDDRTCLHFALGKAYGDRTNYSKSFDHYARGNALQRLAVEHDPEILTAYVSRATKVFSPDLFGRFAGSGSASCAPIFIVGMMRSGSTLVEQILASHSQIEGTRELAEISALSQDLQRSAAQRRLAYPELLEQLEPDVLRQLAEQYLENTLMRRKLGRPRFIDKMGANFAHLGLIHLLFPGAKIVDVRRHPLACGFSIFAQYFPKGQNNTWRLSDIGRTYRDYVTLTDHFDRVLPGRVHRVFYEHLVATPEAEIRRLLEYLEIPFEGECLEFHRTERAVATISAEQVRQPLYRMAVEHWRNYEPWLAPLKAALGPALENYPAVRGAVCDASGKGGSG